MPARTATTSPNEPRAPPRVLASPDERRECHGTSAQAAWPRPADRNHSDGSRSRHRCARSVRLGCHDLRRAAADDRRDERRRQPAGHGGTRRHRRPRRQPTSSTGAAATTSCAAAVDGTSCTAATAVTGCSATPAPTRSTAARVPTGCPAATATDSLTGDAQARRAAAVQVSDDDIAGGPGQDTVVLWKHPRAKGNIKVDLGAGTARGQGNDTPALDRGRVRRQRARRRTRGQRRAELLLLRRRSRPRAGTRRGRPVLRRGRRRPARRGGRVRTPSTCP